MAIEQITKPASTPKFEAFVEQQLAQVRRRLRALDVGAACLLLLAVTLGYATLMAGFDLLVRDSSESWVSGVRLGAFGFYLLAMLAGGYLLVVRLLRRINPYYCAHELEQTLPDAKNSVINWLDLKHERLPSAIRASLGMKAARDLKEADPDQVVDPKHNWKLGAIAALFFAVLVVIFARGPSQFGSLLARAFLPLRDIRLANRATITLIRPAGDAAVMQNQRVEFLAQIEGRFPKVNHPQAPTLWYRHGPGDPFASMALEEDGNGQWGAVLAADLVRTGFWYKISAGDAETPLYQVSVRSLPAATRFEVTYRYRPYLKAPEQTVVFPNEHAVFPDLNGHRGTEVTMVVRTNQPVREGKLQLQFGKDLKVVNGERLADDPKAFRCRFFLERSGQYLVLFKTQEEEPNSDRSPYQIEVIDDTTPVAVLTKPGQDTSIAANGTLPLEGHALDDFGVKSLALQLRVLEGKEKPNLAAKPYRPGKSFQFETGHYPTKLAYTDLLALDQLKTVEGTPFAAAPGMVLEYWLEATDNSDYPSASGNVGKSKAYKLKIEPPQDPKKQKQDRDQAQEQQKKSEQQQDRQHKKENQSKKDDMTNRDAKKSPDERKADDLNREKQDVEDKIKEALKREEEKKQQGGAKGDDKPQTDNKPGDGQQPDAKPKDTPANSKPQQAGDKKDDGKKGDGADSSQAKNQGDKQPPGQSPEKQQASEPKGPGNEKPQPSAKGQNPKDQPGNGADQQPASAKGGPQDNVKEQPGKGKDEGKQTGMNQTAQAKENAPKDDKMNPSGSEPKGAQGSKDAPPPQAKNEKKGPNDQAGKKGDTKPGQGEQLTQEKGQGKTKPDASASKNPPGADGERKPAQAKGNEEPTQKSQAKNGEGQGTETQQGPPAQAKNQPMNPNPMNPKGEPQGTAKETPADQSKESASAKNEHGDAPPREPTLKDLERLKEQLEKGDPKALKTAEELKRNLPEAKDPKLGKAAEELLQGAAKKLDELAKQEAKINPSVAGGQDPSPMNMGDPNKGEPGGNQPSPMTSQGGNDPKTKPGTNPGTKPSGSGPDGQGAQDKPNPSVADKSNDRVGNLQLEHLRDRVTPDVLKQAGVTPEEWQQYLKNAQAYEELRNKIANQPKIGPDKLKGKTSQLTNVGPRSVQSPAGAANPANIGQGVVPPELRRAQELFTKKQ